MAFWPLFLIAQAAAVPVLAPGSEVRLVSPDLLRVHASGRVEAGALTLRGELPPGLEVRVLVFPPDAAPEDEAAALSGATALAARVGEDGRDLILRPAGGEPVALRDALREQGIDLRLVDGSGGS